MNEDYFSSDERAAFEGAVGHRESCWEGCGLGECEIGWDEAQLRGVD